MSSSTSSSTGIGPFTGGFSLGAAVVGVASILIGILAIVDAYQQRGILITADDPMLKGVVILVFSVAIGIIALFIGAYMQPGIGDDEHGH